MGEIALRTSISVEADVDQVREVLDSALRREAELAYARCTHFERACRAFEQRYQISSEKFIERFEAGSLGDDAEYFDWYAAKRGWDLWERRFRILSGIKV